MNYERRVIISTYNRHAHTRDDVSWGMGGHRCRDQVSNISALIFLHDYVNIVAKPHILNIYMI